MKESPPEPEKSEKPSPDPGELKSVCYVNDLGELEAWDDYWEDMLLISRGPRGWNIGCA